MNEKIRNYLEENEVRLLEENQLKYSEILKKHNLDKYEDFYEFMRLYGGDLEGRLGYMFDVVDDIDDSEGVTQSLIKNENVPNHYISLQDLDYEHFLLYDINNDHVIFVEGANTENLLNNNFDNQWSSFNEFLEWFFEIE
jgi:hypothetical protein